MITVRPYRPDDYEAVTNLYKQSNLYGGQFDEHRDSEGRLRKRTEADPDAILMAEEDDKIVGTVSYIEDGRVAWLFRFAVMQTPNEKEISQALSDKAFEVLKARGHSQVLVYTPVGDKHLDDRYETLEFNRGSDYTCYWKDIV